MAGRFISEASGVVSGQSWLWADDEETVEVRPGLAATWTWRSIVVEYIIVYIVYIYSIFIYIVYIYSVYIVYIYIYIKYIYSIYIQYLYI